jgi:hypothetical protein
MSNYYIVQKIGWQYNDEYYYQGEDGGGTPEMAFQDKAKAEACADQLNAKEMSGNNIGSYCSDGDLSNIIEDVAGFVEAYNQIFAKKIKETDLDSWEFELPKMTLEQYLQIKPFVTLRFFEVNECPAGD